MPTPHFKAYPTVDTVMMGSLAIECFDYDQLTWPAEQRGEDFKVETVAGSIPGGRLDDATRRIIEIRVRGQYDEDNNVVWSAESDKVLGYYGHLETLKALRGGPHPITLHVDGTEWTGPGTVERLAVTNRLNPWTYELAMELTLHDGQLTKVVA